MTLQKILKVGLANLVVALREPNVRELTAPAPTPNRSLLLSDKLGCLFGCE